MTSFPTDSITRQIALLKDGNEDAAASVWQQYFHRVVRLAGQKLPGRMRAVGPDDVAQEAFFSLIRGAQAGRFRKLEDRDDLWQLLTMLTIRKIARKIEHEGTQKRGRGVVRGESALGGRAFDIRRTLADVVADEPTPEDVDALAQQCEDLLSRLQTTECREVAILKMQGFTCREISEQFERSERWVERKLSLIRTTLAEMDAEPFRD